MEKEIKEFISSIVSTGTNTWVILKDTLCIEGFYAKPKFPDKKHLWGTLCQLALNLFADATKCLLSTIQQNLHPLSLPLCYGVLLVFKCLQLQYPFSHLWALKASLPQSIDTGEAAIMMLGSPTHVVCSKVGGG